MMNDLLKIQSDPDRRPKQMKSENKKSDVQQNEENMGLIEPNPLLANSRLFGPKCSTQEWLGGFRAMQLTDDSLSKTQEL